MNCSGIYTITNLVNNKIYVGSGTVLTSRRTKHLKTLRENIHPNIRLQRSFNKHGENAFKFEILEECEKPLLRDLENYWINMLDAYNPERGYNIKNPFGKGFKFSEEARAKISAANKQRTHSEETKRKIGLGNKGKIISTEQRAQVSKVYTGLKHTEATKLKMSLSKIGKLRGKYKTSGSKGKSSKKSSGKK